jgi:hypothetical protein
LVEEGISVEPEEGQLRFEIEIDRGEEIPREVKFTGERGIGVAVEVEGVVEAEVEVEAEVGNGSRSRSWSRNGSGDRYGNEVMIGDNVGAEIAEMGFGQGMKVGEIENPADDEVSEFPTIRIEDEMDFW